MAEAARYEHRAWAEAFPDLPQPAADAWDAETYFIRRDRLDVNVKARSGAVEIKELVEVKDGLQLWRPAGRLDLPASGRDLTRVLKPWFGVELPLAAERLDLAALERALAAVVPDLLAVQLRKRRHLFEAAGVRAECTEVRIADRRVMTAAAEHEDPAVLRRAVDGLGLGRFANLAYPAALTGISS
jgi:hypothetical protein